MDLIECHGTGTPINDRVETLAIKKVFGHHVDNLAISSIKGMIGHTLGAASAIETVACALVIERGIVPPTINYTAKDMNCDLNYTPNRKIYKTVDSLLNNAFAFGGNNSCLLLKRYEHQE